MVILMIDIWRMQKISAAAIQQKTAAAQADELAQQILIIKPTRCTNFSNLFLE